MAEEKQQRATHPSEVKLEKKSEEKASYYGYMSFFGPGERRAYFRHMEAAENENFLVLVRALLDERSVYGKKR